MCNISIVQVLGKGRRVMNCPLHHKLHSNLNGALNVPKKAMVISTMIAPLGRGT
jgi:hypothetical protein